MRIFGPAGMRFYPFPLTRLSARSISIAKSLSCRAANSVCHAKVQIQIVTKNEFAFLYLCKANVFCSELEFHESSRVQIMDDVLKNSTWELLFYKMLNIFLVSYRKSKAETQLCDFTLFPSFAIISTLVRGQNQG